MPRNDLIEKSVTNIFWSYVSFFCTKVLNLVALIVLARFLPPAEFGLMAFCIVIVGYFEMFSRFGLGAAVISAQEDVDATADAVFWFALLISASMAATVWLSADAFGRFFGQPELADILPVLSLSMVVVSFSAVHNSLLQKELRFRDRFCRRSSAGWSRACSRSLSPCSASASGPWSTDTSRDRWPSR